MDWEVPRLAAFGGRVDVPGDKSIGHRAVLLAALADGTSRLVGLPRGEDVASTVRVVQALGVEVDEALPSGPSVDNGRHRDSVTTVIGSGLRGLAAPRQRLDCGNSGTTMRLLAGVLAGQTFASELVGDRSLSRRPMSRVAEPLRAMGARVETSPDGRPPLRILCKEPGRLADAPLRGVVYRPPVASAQIKSCVLLAGLYADGRTQVVESLATRDHTERMLAAMGAKVECHDEFTVSVHPDASRLLSPLVSERRVPGDASSAAYWLAAATLSGQSEAVARGAGGPSVLTMAGVGLNPRRIAFLELLISWGADIRIDPVDDWHGEPVGDLRVRSSGRLRGGRIEADAVPGLIDELPLLAMLGPSTELGVEIRGAAELRHKESDRIASTAAALRALGASVDEYPDGLSVAGGQGLAGGVVDAAGDHRIALASAAVSVVAQGAVLIRGAEAIAVSYPEFRPDWEGFAA